MLGEVLMEKGFEIGEVLGAVEEGVADEGNPGPLVDLQWEARLDGSRPLRAWSCFLIDGVLGQARILYGLPSFLRKSLRF